MRKVIFILLSLLPFFTEAQTANAGADQTIYLTSGNTATLNGSSSSGSTYLWSEVSTDYSSGATITNGTTKTATVSGLPQGVWYFKIAVTTGGTTYTDITTVTVDYAPQPYHSTLAFQLPIAGVASIANSRSGSVSDYNGYNAYNHYSVAPNQLWIERSHAEGASVDAQKSKYYTTLEDGYPWHGNSYDRSEMYIADSSAVNQSQIYCYEWKGYYPQAIPSGAGDFGTIMQLHGSDGLQPVFIFLYSARLNGLEIIEVNPSDVRIASSSVIYDFNTMINQTHTIRVTFKEGSSGWIRVEVDGTLKYYRAGAFGRGTTDFAKFATLYDSGNGIVDPNNHTRDRKFSMVTESFKVYHLSDTATSVVTAPTANAGSNPTITLPTSSVSLSGSATHATGYTNTYLWSKISGSGTQSIAGNTTLTPTVSGMDTAGSYVFRLTVNQSDGQSVYDDVTITVNPAIAAPTVSTSGNQTLTLPTNSTTVYSTPHAASGHTIISFAWSDIGSGTATITSPSSQNTTITGLSSGTHTFQILVHQNDGQTATATLTVTVNSATAPTIYAGNNQTLPHGSTASLAATYTTASGLTATFNWVNETDGTGSFSAQTSATTTVSGLANGTYRFGCTLTQSDGQTAYDYVIVTISGVSQSISVIITNTPQIFIQKK